jgi:small subunit ribosomal protein S21
LQVVVRDNNVDQALKVLKKKMQREGIFRELKMKDAYEKPSIKRAREQAEAIRRARKLARKKLQREGLLPAPKKIEKPRRGGMAGGMSGGIGMIGGGTGTGGPRGGM